MAKSWMLGREVCAQRARSLTKKLSGRDSGDKAPCQGSPICWSAMIHAARSFHPGGVNVCLADGSVRFVDDRIDQFVREGLASINGEEVGHGSAF